MALHAGAAGQDHHARRRQVDASASAGAELRRQPRRPAGGRMIEGQRVERHRFHGPCLACPLGCSAMSERLGVAEVQMRAVSERRGRAAAGSLVPAPFPRAEPWRAAEASAHRPGPASTASAPRARTGSSPARPSACRPASPPTPPPKPREIADASPTATPQEIQRLVIHKDDHVIVAEQAAGAGRAGRHRHRAACRRHARCAALRLRGAAAAGPSPGQGYLRPAADRAHRPGGQAAGRIVPRPRDREALLGGRGRRAAAAGRRHRPAARQAAGRARSRD